MKWSPAAVAAGGVGPTSSDGEVSDAPTGLSVRIIKHFLARCLQGSQQPYHSCSSGAGQFPQRKSGEVARIITAFLATRTEPAVVRFLGCLAPVMPRGKPEQPTVSVRIQPVGCGLLHQGEPLPDPSTPELQTAFASGPGGRRYERTPFAPDDGSPAQRRPPAGGRTLPAVGSAPTRIRIQLHRCIHALHLGSGFDFVRFLIHFKFVPGSTGIPGSGSRAPRGRRLSAHVDS